MPPFVMVRLADVDQTQVFGDNYDHDNGEGVVVIAGLRSYGSEVQPISSGTQHPQERPRLSYGINDDRLWIANPTDSTFRGLVSLPPEAKCTELLGKPLPRTWFCDNKGKRKECYSLCIDVLPRRCIIVCTLAMSRGVKLSFTSTIAHPEKQPSVVPKWTFPIARTGGEPCYCVQGWGGVLTHFGMENHHAVDISCPEGTPVLAAADGIVCGVVNDQITEGGHINHLFRGYNHVTVKHEDGTQALYLHNSKGTAKVAEGDAVKAGQTLALTGKTGFAPWPHLHFQVNRGSFAEATTPEDCPSVPVVFGGADGAPFLPVAGKWYTEHGLTSAPADAPAHSGHSCCGHQEGKCGGEAGKEEEGEEGGGS